VRFVTRKHQTQFCTCCTAFRLRSDNLMVPQDSSLATRWTTGFHILVTTSRPVLGCTQPFNAYSSVEFSQSSGVGKLSGTHFHIMHVLRMRGTLPPCHSYSLMLWWVSTGEIFSVPLKSIRVWWDPIPRGFINTDCILPCGTSFNQMLMFKNSLNFAPWSKQYAIR